MNVEAVVQTVIRDKLGLSHYVDIDMDLMEMGMNSFNFIEIVVELEEKLGIEFDDSELVSHKYPTVRDFVKYIMTFGLE